MNLSLFFVCKCQELDLGKKQIKMYPSANQLSKGVMISQTVAIDNN